MPNAISKLAIALIVVTSCSQISAACETDSNLCYSSQRSTQYSGSRKPTVRYYIVPPRATHSSRTATKPRVGNQNQRTTNLPIVETGASYRLSGHNYGIQLGSISLNVGEIEIECDVLTWAADEVTFSVPPLKLKNEVVGELAIRTPAGRTVSVKTVRLRGVTIQQQPVPSDTIEPIPAPPVVPAPSITVPFDMGQGLEGS